MDFFERQDNARRKTRYLVLLFILAAICIVVAVDIAAGLIFGMVDSQQGTAAFTGQWVVQNAGMFTATSLATLSFIGLSSAYRVASLSAGGSKVAQSLGGAQVSPDTQDPLRKRLHNVVEEIAIASGVPVPEVYVLERESGINAFAAGFNTSDAVVAVTRGTLENLDRDELQGVIAHEFSHILNGDMRLNMRLMGVVFGILALGIVGRTVLRASRHARISSRSEKSGGAVAAIMLMGVALFVIGYIGVMFGRLIKAAVSRQREYLADASAVQFTRQTDGIAGALKKIGALNSGSLIKEADSEEVGHMLFATGSRLAALWATHPPLQERILALDPSFKPEDLTRLATEMHAARAREFTEEKPEEKAPPKHRAWFPGMIAITPGAITDAVGNPGLEHFLHAAVLRDSLPGPLLEAAHNPAQAVLLTAALLLDKRPEIRSRQLTLIDSRLGQGAADVAMQWFGQLRELGFEHRLPLLEILFPAIKQRPLEDIDAILSLCEAMMQVDGLIDTFEFTLTGVLKTHLRDARNPSAAGRGKAALSSLYGALQTLFSVLAATGHTDEAEAGEAYLRGVRALEPADPSIVKALDDGRFPGFAPPDSGQLEPALLALDTLELKSKAVLLRGLVTTVMNDGKVTVGEAELLRAICAMLHCPLPPLTPPAGSAAD